MLRRACSSRAAAARSARGLWVKVPAERRRPRASRNIPRYRPDGSFSAQATVLVPTEVEPAQPRSSLHGSGLSETP